MNKLSRMEIAILYALSRGDLTSRESASTLDKMEGRSVSKGTLYLSLSKLQEKDLIYTLDTSPRRFSISKLKKTKETTNHKLFLCHSSADKRFVRKLAHDLDSLAIEVWFDEWQLGPGDSLYDCIGTALNDAAYVAVVLSPNSDKSTWVRKELNQALSRESRSGRSLVLPLLRRKVAIPSFLEDRLYVDFRHSYLKALTQLSGRLHDLEVRRIMEQIPQASLASVDDVRVILERAGLKGPTVIRSPDWRKLVQILRKHNIDISGDRFSVFDPSRNLRIDVE